MSGLRPVGDSSTDRAACAVRVDLVGGRLSVTGRLDRRTAHLLHDAVSTLLFADHERWAVDVTGLTVGDAATVRTISGAYRRLLRHGRRMTLLGASPPLRQALTRLRLDPHLLDEATDRPTGADAVSA
ncbi:STAS domain-containing protein [Geodermatophilus sp. URMC 65]